MHDESFLVNEAEKQSDENADEPDAEAVTEAPKKEHKHRGRTLHKDLPTLIAAADCMSLLPSISQADLP